MESYICDICKAEFTAKSSLIVHQKTAKFCLKLQEKTNTSYTCNGCNKILANKSYLDKHIVKCTALTENKLNYEIETLKELSKQQCLEIEDKINQLSKLAIKHQEDLNEKDRSMRDMRDHYESKVSMLKTENIKLKAKVELLEDQNKLYQERLIDKATSKTNHTTNNVINLNTFLTPEYIEKTIQTKFTKDYLLQSVPGIAKFVKIHIATDQNGTLIYMCSDSSRYNFRFVDENGVEVKDIRAAKLIEIVQPHLYKKIFTFWEKYCEDIEYHQERLLKEKNNDNCDEEDIEYLNTRILEQTKYKEGARSLLEDVRDMFGTKMVSELAKQLC